jgi:hypothetical protein
LLLLLTVHSLILPLAVHRAAPGVRTAGDQLARFAARSQSADSWEPMGVAQAYATTHPGASLYEEVFFRERTKFQYPPTSLLFVQALSRRTLNVLSWAAVWVTATVTLALTRRGARLAGMVSPSPVGPVEAVLRGAIVLALALTFYPLLRAYTLGQIQVWLDALFAIFVLAWWTGYRPAAGMTLGLLCLIKPPFALIAIWAAVRRDYRLLAGAALVGVVGIALSIHKYGFASHRDYARVLSFLSHHGEAFYANQSVNGLLNRLFRNGDARVWQEHAFPPSHPIVYRLTLASSLMLATVALVVPQRRGFHGTIVDLALISVVSVVAAPIAWEHHYGILLPLFGATGPMLIAVRAFGRYTAACLALAYLLTGEFVAPGLLRFSGSAPGLLQSHVLAGALLFMLALLGGATVSQPPTTTIELEPSSRQQPAARGPAECGA